MLICNPNTVMLMMLRKLGYGEVLVADQGQHALDLLEQQRTRGPQHQIDAILMDASMDVSGATQTDTHAGALYQTARPRSDPAWAV